MAELFQQLDRIADDVSSAFEPLRKSLSKVESLSFSPELQQQFQETFQAIEETLQRLPEDTRFAQQYLADRSWFISFRSLSPGQIRSLAQHAERGEHDKIEVFVLEHSRELVQPTREKVSDLYPDRFEIVEEALDSHEAGQYAVSIPTMLAQADGMFAEITGEQFFSNRRRDLKCKRRDLLTALREAGRDATASSLSHLMIRQLYEESTLHEIFSDTDRHPISSSAEGPLNRQFVLHGRTTGYNTEKNSLRALALLDLLCDTKDLTQNET